MDGASYEFDIEKVRHGKLSPVFFGSALTNFGVETFLENFLQMTTPPLPRKTIDGMVDPFDESFSAFVFKIQANMNKNHRDRIAFMRICSGKFQKDTEYLHVQEGKRIKLAQPQQMMAGKPRDHRRGVCRRYHRGVRPRHFLHRGYGVRPQDEGAV